jgi:hypothetical protein
MYNMDMKHLLLKPYRYCTLNNRGSTPMTILVECRMNVLIKETGTLSHEAPRFLSSVDIVHQ